MKTKLLPACLLFVVALMALLTLTGCRSKQAELEAWKKGLDTTQPLAPIISVPDIASSKTFTVTLLCPDGAGCSILWLAGTREKPVYPKNGWGANVLKNGKGKVTAAFEAPQDGYFIFWGTAEKCDIVPEHLAYTAGAPAFCRNSGQGEIKEVLVDTGQPALTNLQISSDDESFTVTGVVKDTGSGIGTVLVAGKKATIATVNGVQMFSAVVPFNSLVNTTSGEIVAIDRGHLRARFSFKIPVPPNRWELWSMGSRREIRTDPKFVPEPGIWVWGYGPVNEWRYYEDGVLRRTLDTPAEWYLLCIGVFTVPFTLLFIVAFLIWTGGMTRLGLILNRAAALVEKPTTQALVSELADARSRLSIWDSAVALLAQRDPDTAEKVARFMNNDLPGLLAHPDDQDQERS